MSVNRPNLKALLTARQNLLDWTFGDGWAEIENTARELTASLKDGGAVFSCGNGGSASQAEHFAAELAGRFKLDRKSLPVFSLSTNTASLTAIANDFGFAEMFARQIEGIGKKGDALVALSTSGNSENILRACRIAREKEMVVYGLTGETGGKMSGECDHIIRIPETDTARIQEIHLVALHMICQIIEESLFSEQGGGMEST